MTGQIPDEVRYRKRWFAIAAVDGEGLFEPAQHGLEPGFLGTGCWRGFQARYRIHRRRLSLYDVCMGRRDGDRQRLFGVAPVRAVKSHEFEGEWWYRGLAAPVPFTGRMLLGVGFVHIGYLNMGFQPAWLFKQVYEVAFEAGRLIRARDRSMAAAGLRHRLGTSGLQPAPGEESGDWIKRTFSLSFDYSWPQTADISAADISAADISD